MAPGVKGRGIYIYTSAIFFLAFFADSSPPMPTPLGPPHRGRRAATPPDVGRRHRLTRVHGPHATPRADDLAAPAAARPPRLDARPHHRYPRPGQTRGHTAPVPSPSRPGQTRGHTAGTLAPARRAATPPAAPRYASCACSDPIPSISMHETLRTYVLGNDHGNRTYMFTFFLFLRACFDTVAKLCWLSLAYVRTSTNVCIDHKPKRILS